MAGEYAIHVLCDSDDIPKSPFIAQICQRGSFRPDLVQCFGAGIEAHGVILGIETEFMIDTSIAGNAPLQINVSSISMHYRAFALFLFPLLQRCKTLSGILSRSLLAARMLT